MNKTVFTLATLIGLSAAGSAFAQGLEFNALDANQDGEITIEELQVAIPDITPETFALLDTDGSGALSPEEFNALIAPAESPAPLAPDAPAAEPLDAPVETY